jgi:hypothetical protein
MLTWVGGRAPGSEIERESNARSISFMSSFEVPLVRYLYPCGGRGGGGGFTQRRISKGLKVSACVGARALTAKDALSPWVETQKNK